MPEPTNPPLPIKEYKIISFDVFGTLIEYKSHILKSFRPMIDVLPEDSPYRNSTPISPHIPGCATIGDVEFLKLFQKEEDKIKLEAPSDAQNGFENILRELWARIQSQLEAKNVDGSSRAFGHTRTIESWPYFPGTGRALWKLQKALPDVKLVALSNIDSFATYVSLTATKLDHIKWAKSFAAENYGSSLEDLKHADDRKFETLLKWAKKKNVDKQHILHVAQSLGHDHAPAKKFGISSVFLTGDGPKFGKEEESRMAVEKELVGYGWRFKDLLEFYKLIEEELAADKEKAAEQESAEQESLSST